MEHLGKLSCNPREEVWISLQEEQGRGLLELQVYGSPGAGKGPALPRGDAIHVPINQLPKLLQLLAQVRELCVSRGYLYEPGPAVATTMERGEPVALPVGGRSAMGRREPRVPVGLPIECRLRDSERFWPLPPVIGELRDISLHGAQMWLPRALPRFEQVDITGTMGRAPFHACAKIVSVAVGTTQEPARQTHRHGLQWVVMEPETRELLARLLTAGSAEAKPRSPAPHPAPPGEPDRAGPGQDVFLSSRDEAEAPEEAASPGKVKVTKRTPRAASGERRRTPRVVLSQAVPMWARAGGDREIRLLDLSPTGARIEHRSPLRPGTLCALGFPAAATPMVLLARVVRSEDLGEVPTPTGSRQRRYATGISFAKVTPEQQAVLRRIVEWLALGGSAEGILTLVRRRPNAR